MCGIHGIVNLAARERPSLDAVHAMGNITVHRGPDDEGTYADEHVAFGMRRLSIIDVGGGHQPIPNEDETLWLVCNGEIYNFRELREELLAAGHRFRTGSDSEVILHLYEQHGDRFVERLEGMFGFALWDTKRRRMLIGRDALGIKPVYYAELGGRLLFASELKSLLAVPGFSADIDEASLSEYFSLGYCAAPRSMFRGISKLPPASLLVCEDGKQHIQRYWRLPADTDNTLSDSDWVDAVRDAIETSVRAQMVSDVPLGAFLSGGIDSSAVVAMMAKHSDRPVKTYAIGFGGSSGGSFYNELPYARQVAEMFGTDHREIVVEPNVAELLPRLLWHMDEPMADSAFVTTYLVAEFARRDVTVILSGVGGDELFGGYRRYLGEYYGRLYNRFPQWMRSGVFAPVARRLPATRESALMNLSRYARTFVLANEQPFEARYRDYVQVFGADERARLLPSAATSKDALDRAFDEVQDDDALKRLFGVDLATQLPDDLLMLTDKMTMATSIECRVPLLDQRLVELAARMPSRLKIHGRDLKHVLKRALADVLPKEILYRKKRGFGAPMGAWLKRELEPLMLQILSRESVTKRGLLHWPEVERTIALHRSNREDHTDHLQAMMNLELWARIYLDGASPGDVAGELVQEAAA